MNLDDKYPNFICKKQCNICSAEFVDNTRNRNKKSCSKECRKKFCVQFSMNWIKENKDHYLKLRRARRLAGSFD